MSYNNPFMNDEERLMRYLADAYNLFINLPQTHPSHINEFVSSIHKCQDVITHRIVQ